jgi:hypothetical protein
MMAHRCSAIHFISFPLSLLFHVQHRHLNGWLAYLVVSCTGPILYNVARCTVPINVFLFQWKAHFKDGSLRAEKYRSS